MGTLNTLSGLLHLARCSLHHSLEHTTIWFASSHPSPVVKCFNSINNVNSLFIVSNLFFNCVFTNFYPDRAKNFSTRLLQPFLVHKPFGRFPASTSSMQMSMKCFKFLSFHTAFSFSAMIGTRYNHSRAIGTRSKHYLQQIKKQSIPHGRNRGQHQAGVHEKKGSSREGEGV